MRKVCYLYNQDFTNFTLAQEHPMKPMRLKMVHSLINSYGLSSLISMYYSKQVTNEDLCLFHHPHYVKYLETWVTPDPSAALDSFSPPSIAPLQ
jgi:histone deacetylase 1/2